MKRGRIWKIGIIMTILALSYETYDAVYPSDSFYEKEFERVSGLPYPKSGVIKLKDSTYPDIHGDYSSCALIEVSVNDFLRLRNTLLFEPTHTTGTLTSLCEGLSLEKANAPKSNLAIEKEFNERTGEASGWGVLEGSQLIYFYYWSS